MASSPTRQPGRPPPRQRLPNSRSHRIGKLPERSEDYEATLGQLRESPCTGPLVDAFETTIAQVEATEESN